MTNRFLNVIDLYLRSSNFDRLYTDKGVKMEIFSSDSDSDLEVLAQLSDWDSSDSEQERAVSSKTFRRINFMASLTDAEFIFRFRMNKASVESVLNEIMPYIKVKSRR